MRNAAEFFVGILDQADMVQHRRMRASPIAGEDRLYHRLMLRVPDRGRRPRVRN